MTGGITFVHEHSSKTRDRVTMALTFGQLSATASTRLLTMPALMLNRSSRVMPGLRGTPAGMTTTSTPFKAAASSSAPVNAATC